MLAPQLRMDDPMSHKNGSQPLVAGELDRLAPIRYHTEVKPEWIDSNQHMNTFCYQTVFDGASDLLLQTLDYSAAFRQRSLHTSFVLETHMRYLRELLLGDQIVAEVRLVGVDDKRFHLLYTLSHVAQAYVAATCEALLINVDQATRRAAPFLPELRERMERLLRAHQQLAPIPGPRFVKLAGPGAA